MEALLLMPNKDVDMELMKIKYGGGNEIEANTYINSLIHFTKVIQEVNKSISSDKKVEVKIKANKEGSFVVDVLIASNNIIEGIKEIFSEKNVTYAAGLIYIVGEVFKVAKHLKGDKPKKIKNDKDSVISIENNEGQVMVFDFRGANIYLNNHVIQEAIEQEFETLEKDESVTDLELLDKEEKPIVEIKKEEFYNLSSSGSNLNELSIGDKEVNVTATLNISSLDLEFKKKWDFYYLGNKIQVKIKDEAFSERVDKGERFAKGDTLEVEMEIKQKFDESVNAYVNKSYTITKILNHIERPPQGKLGL